MQFIYLLADYVEAGLYGDEEMNGILKDCWYVAAMAEDVTRTPLAKVVCNEPLVLYRKESGETTVLANLCSHRRAPLSKGKLIGDRIQCPYHGIEFDAEGQCVLIPCQTRIPAKAHIKLYPSREWDGAIWVWMGDPALADDTSIPRAPWVGNPDWNSSTVHRYHVPAQHVLTTDNLLDLGHVAFIHADTIGFDASLLTEDPLVTEVDGDCIRNTRVFKDVQPSAVVQSWAEFPGLIERTSVSEWFPPCYTYITFRNADSERSLELRINHYITPETDKSHHYWVRVSRNFRIDDEELTHKIYEGNEKVHAQDLDIILAQQQMWDLVPDKEEIMISQDRGVVAAHRILERMAQKERENSQESRHTKEEVV